MDKKALFRKMGEAVALETALIEAERTAADRTASPDVAQALTGAARDDDGHLTLLRRVIRDLGGKAEPAAMDNLAWVETLVRNVSTSEDEVDRLGLVRMLKARAVADGEMFDQLRFVLGNPPELEPLVMMLRQDRDHALRLSQLEARLIGQAIIL